MGASISLSCRASNQLFDRWRIAERSREQGERQEDSSRYAEATAASNVDCEESRIGFSPLVGFPVDARRFLSSRDFAFHPCRSRYPTSLARMLGSLLPRHGSNRDRMSVTDVNLLFCASVETKIERDARARELAACYVPTFRFAYFLRKALRFHRVIVFDCIRRDSFLLTPRDTLGS